MQRKQSISRRRMLGTVGAATGIGAAFVCGARTASGDGEETESGAWTYHELDPEATAQVAYDLYPKGSCMYAVFNSVMQQLGEDHGEPYASFPTGMMHYGHSGAGGWGSLCGALNGAAALFGLFVEERDEVDQMVDCLFYWYENEPLPVFAPDPSADTVGEAASEAASEAVEAAASSEGDVDLEAIAEAAGEAADAAATQTTPALLEIPSSTSESVLCHISCGTWSETTGLDITGPSRKERCRRLSADVAMKTAEILNAYFADGREFSLMYREVRTKVHASQAAKMACATCHDHMDVDISEH
jgi:hypothetical protein